MWSWTYTMNLQLRIFWLQCSSDRISAAIGDISTIQCSSYSKRCAKYSAYPSDYAILSVVPAMYSAVSALHIHDSIFEWTYLSCYWRYVDNSMRLVLLSLCQIPVYAIWTVVPNIYNDLTAPHIQDSIFNWTYLHCYWRYVDNSASVIPQTLSPILRTSSRIRYVNCGLCHVQYNYRTPHTGYNIQLKVSALL
jgi:hypothetical protein